MRMWRAFALHGDVPTGRACAWNVAAAVFAAGDLWAAHRIGVLGWVLAALAGMVAATGVALVRIERRHSGGVATSPIPDEVAEERERVTAAMAARRIREAA